MSLINCSECGREISSKAESCPSCGNPISHHIVEVTKTVEVEQTSKKFKRGALWATFFFLLGLFIMTKNGPLGFIIVFCAIMYGAINRIGAWWRNG